ncbi:hypothetical protein BE08_02945 [Sorangium cellulosum]|uniref:PBS lyase n=1 Tax=Sorangium cellulosum TaxID=56 RepID=A0A150P284_SORCE|nr:hypothetical protein BE08_02945 [Sorangium cellulosum]
MTVREQILAALREGALSAGRRIAQDPEGRAVLLEIAREAGSAERIAAADALLAATPRLVWGCRCLCDEAGLSIASAVEALVCDGDVPPEILPALGDPCRAVRYNAVLPLQGRMRGHDALVYLRAEARYGPYKATDIGLEALTTAEDLRALLGVMAPEDLPVAVMFLDCARWSDPLRQEASRLLGELLHHPDWRVRAAAAITCWRPDTEDPAARAAILDAIRVPELWIQAMAVARLAEDPASYPVLRAASRDPDSALRNAVSAGIHFSGVREAIELLEGAGDEPRSS